MRPAPDDGATGSDLFRAMLERGSDVISLHDRDAIMRYQSPSITRILGYTPGELIGRPVLDYIHPDDIDATRRALGTIVAEPGAHAPFETRFRHKDGSYRWFECRGTNLLDDPAVRAIIFNSSDITDRKAADEALRRSEAYFRALIEHMSDVVTVLSGEGVILYESPSLVRVLGYAPDELVGRHVGPYVHPDDARRVQEAFALALQDTQHRFRFRHKDGSWRILEAVGRAVPDAGSGPMVIVTSRDITERVRTEAELQRIDRLLHTIVSGAPMVVFALDRAGIFTLSIGSGLEKLGLQPGEVVGQSIFDIYPNNTEVQEQIRRAIAGEAFVSFGEEGGRTFQIWWAPTRAPQPDGTAVVGVAMDITDRRELEEQLRQAQRLESIGLLAGGVAHDFNNMLTVINGYSELLLDQLPSESPWRHDLDEVRKAGEKAASLAYQLLAFSRKQMLQPRSVDLNVIVRDVTRMLQRIIGEHIELRTSLAPDLRRVHADPNQLVQVLLNLAVNARDAMPDGGVLTVATRNGPPAPGTRPPEVQLSVSDTGIGMDDATQHRIFEPFFTTKPTGKGTGMGLATVYGIVKQSGGDIRVRSAPGAGSTFTIVLPQETSAATGDFMVSPAAPRGTERILLVEDEALVRELTARILTALGYHVTEAGDPTTAIARWSADPEGFDLLLTDVVLPHMSGRELASTLTRSGTPTKVLYMSGYTDDAVLQRGVASEAMPFVQKPFTAVTLAVAIRSVLDGPRSAS